MADLKKVKEGEQSNFFDTLGVPPVVIDKVKPREKHETWSQHDRYVARINSPIVRRIIDGELKVIGMNDT